MAVCYVVFEASPKEYSYGCGGLTPSPGDLIVVQVGADNRNKIVRCVRVSDEEDRMAYKQIFGIVQLQPQPKG